MSKVFGIDISKYQKGMNLTKAKNEGVKFAILRAGYTGYGNGVSKAKDEEFETFYKNAKANGLGVGAYWFSRATTYENGKLEAKYMYEKCLKGKQFEYPIYIDVEDTYYQSKAGKTAITNGIKGFCEYLENKGYYVGIYASSSWFKSYIDASIPSKYDCWVANWGTKNPSTPSHGMWQFGGETNKIRTNKVAGYTCDQNYAYKDYPTIIKSKGLNGFTITKEETPTTTPTTTTPTAKTRKVGDIVNINGVYISSTSKEKLTPKKTKGTITKIVKGARNPYLLNNGNIGWVNDDCITGEVKPTINYYKSFKNGSIVDGLNSIGVDSSFSNRKKIAKANGISFYIGSKNQNIKLLELAKKGKLIKG